MGNGEVDITAMETSLTGVFPIYRAQGHAPEMAARRRRRRIGSPWESTRSDARRPHLRDLETLDFLVTEKKLSREDAYALASVAVDFDITQLVDGTKGVHGMIPKNIFVK